MGHPIRMAARDMFTTSAHVPGSRPVSNPRNRGAGALVLLIVSEGRQRIGLSVQGSKSDVHNLNTGRT